MLSTIWQIKIFINKVYTDQSCYR